MEHSILNMERWRHSAVTTQTATFIFGGQSQRTYEYLPKDSTTWLLGKTEIPEGFEDGCAIASKSEEEIWLIGGLWNEKRILNFNVNDHTFHEMHFQLNVGRFGHRCAFIPNSNKIMITGGYDLDSTEILDTETGSVTMAAPMSYKRSDHGMSVVTMNCDDRLAIFGGYYGVTDLASLELYNTQTDEWENTSIRLEKPKHGFGYLSVKLSDII